MADGLFDQFRNWYEKRHDYARDWKARTGGQVVATMCTYTAEELLIAAGMLPVRVLGAHEPQNVTEPHISACSVRSAAIRWRRACWVASIMPRALR